MIELTIPLEIVLPILLSITFDDGVSPFAVTTGGEAVTTGGEVVTTGES